MIAKLLMSGSPEPARLNDSGSDILYLLDENRLTDIPVVDGVELIAGKCPTTLRKEKLESLKF